MLVSRKEKSNLNKNQQIQKSKHKQQHTSSNSKFKIVYSRRSAYQITKHGLKRADQNLNTELKKIMISGMNDQEYRSCIDQMKIEKDTINLIENQLSNSKYKVSRLGNRYGDSTHFRTQSGFNVRKTIERPRSVISE